ncbi:MAG: hypothetical protein J2P37_14805 [Ktedonobacteraceae bacterium]|nr:hypothetical protein [Ktedonobacteraceae bacterium]
MVVCQRPRRTSRWWNFWLLLLLVSVLLAGCNSDTALHPGSSTPTSAALQFTPLKLGIPSQALNAPVIGPLPLGQLLHIGVTFKIDQNALKQAGQNGRANSDNNQHVDIAKQFGISDQTYQQVKAFFGISDAKLTLSQTRTWMTVDIKAGSLGTLLQTTFLLHQKDDHTFYTPDPAHMPVLPTPLAHQILSISGLDNFSRPSPPANHQPAVPSSASHQFAGTYCPARRDWPSNLSVIYPADIAHIYGMDRLGVQGEGMKVLLIEAYDTYKQSDLQTYFQCVGYHGQFSTITLDSIPKNDFGFSESELDIEQVAGLAPGANIVVYQGDAYGAWQSGNWWVVVNDLLQRAIADNQKGSAGTVVSISMQADEGYVSQSDLDAIDQSLWMLTSAEHMSVFVSTGDCAAFSLYQYNKLSVSFPASDPWAVAVGGTVLHATQQGMRAAETAWGNASADHRTCNNSWGGGGGLSAAFSMPGWQENYGKAIQGFHNRYSNGARQNADIAVDAANLLDYYHGKWSNGGGGTSASTPIAAAGMSLLNEALIKATHSYYFGPAAYYHAAATAGTLQPFFDVIQGNNIYYPATRGWDYPSGLGVPNYAEFYAVLVSDLKQK